MIIGARLGMSLRQVMEMDVEEFSLWSAFLFGEFDLENRRMDERSALNAAVTVNAAGPRRPCSVEDFMPKPMIHDVEEMKIRLSIWAASTRTGRSK